MRVIVATDGSDAAGLGIDLVAGAVWPPETVVRVVTAIDPRPLTFTGPLGVPVGASPDPLERLDEAAAAALESACRRLRATDPQVEGSLLRGRPASAIVDAARGLDADLVVVGSRGHGLIETMLLGSVSAEVVDHAPMPVLVARGNRLDRVVLAWDGSDCATRAAELLRWPMFARSSVSVVGVAEPEVPWWAGMSGPGAPSLTPLYMESAAASRREYDRLTSTMAAELKAAGLDARAELRSGDAAEEIIAAARATAADLVVVGTHGRSGLARLVTGSVARNVLHHAPCSVLISR